MGWQGYDNEGCMPGDRERFARMRDLRFESDCERHLVSAKRDLAEKVLAAIDGERLHNNLNNEGDKGYMRAIRDVAAAVQRVFTEAGVEVETKGGDASDTTL